MGAIAVVFPGQGSQYVGMGQKFYQADPEARELFALAEAQAGLDLKKLCFEGPLDELTLTKNLQPAMALVDLICWRALARAGVQPLAVAGHSLGEYPALVACGALSAAACLRLTALRGRLMDEDAGAQPGAMAAVMGLAPEAVAALCAEAGGVVQPANYNAPAQTVITGEKAAVAAASGLAARKGGKAIPLKVSGAWHSPLMARAGQEMKKALAATPLAAPACLHVPNRTGHPTQDPAEIAAALADQLTSPVRWVQTVEALTALGVDTFLEAGPKNVLAGLIKKAAPQARAYSFDDPESLAAALAKLDA